MYSTEKNKQKQNTSFVSITNKQLDNIRYKNWTFEILLTYNIYFFLTSLCAMEETFEISTKDVVSFSLKFLFYFYFKSILCVISNIPSACIML